MKRRFENSNEEQLREDYINLYKKIHVVLEDEVNEENIENATKNFASNVNLASNLAEKALASASIKCLSLDSKICVGISSYSKALSQIVRTENKTFTSQLFALKLITYANPSAKLLTDSIEDDENEICRKLDLEDFHQFGKKHSNLVHELPQYHFMFGSFKPDLNINALIKPRKQRTKKTKFNNEEGVKPKAYDDNEIKDVVTQEIEYLFEKLEKICSIKQKCIYKKIMNDEKSYTSTVSNIFHSAFLVKEGVLAIEKDSHGFETVRVLPQEINEKAKDKPRKQGVLTINKLMWNECISKMQN